MQIEDIINEISTSLSIIIYQVKLKSKANLNDVNTLLETPFKDILNIIYDYNLINLNNRYLYPAIDLGDKNKKIAFQITSEKSIQKIKDTLKKFEENNLYNEYEKLKFLIIDEKVNYNKKHDIDRDYFILKDDVISCFELINIIKDLDIEKQKQINDRLRCVVGIKNNISLDTIFDNRNNVPKIEQEYTDKIALTKEILATTLPSELQKYFEIQAKIVNNQFKYILNPSVDNAFELYPIQDKFKMKFSTPKEKEEFIKNGGINALIRQATITRKPVEIPHIEEVKEYIGEYENPFSDFNYTKSNKIKLYVLPHELPRGEKYKIKINDGKEKFSINSTTLQIVDVQKQKIILNNFESTNEDFNITLKLNFTEKKLKIEKPYVKYTANINITLREKKQYSCKANLKLQRFLFLINSANSELTLLHCKENKKVFSIKNLGNKNYSNKDYESFKNYKSLLRKVIYIEKTFKIDIKYNLDYFYKNKTKIDFIYYDSKNRSCKLKTSIKASFYIDEYDEKKHKNIVTDLPKHINLFGNKFILNSTKIILSNCSFYKEDFIDGRKIVTLVSSEVEFVSKNKNI